jgi:hypothetical protein
MRDYGGHISFRPHLPGDCRRVCFRLTIRDNFIQVDIRPDQTTYTLREGPGLHFAHDGEPVDLRADAPAISRATSTASHRRGRRYDVIRTLVSPCPSMPVGDLVARSGKTDPRCGAYRMSPIYGRMLSILPNLTLNDMVRLGSIPRGDNPAA